jgi:hypothetical protein
MTLLELTHKIKYRLWHKLVAFCRNKAMYPYLYRSFWHYKLSRTNPVKNTTCFYSARPNPGAGIGHQLANWIAGYWFAKQFELKFAHIPFSSEKWDRFLGFSENETTVEELLKVAGYKKFRLPLFNECKPEEVNLIKKIIESYKNKKIIFIAEQDQFYRNQIGVIDDIKRKFYSANARKKDQLIFSSNNFNIAVHVRRGDIVVGQKNKNPNLLIRWLDNSYFEKVLSTILINLKRDKPIFIYIFSQGKRNDFCNFDKFENINFCLEMNPQDSFLHMVHADLLITSKSSFSYKPALLSNGIKICPREFWHGYPETNDWILVDNDGTFDTTCLQTIL